MAAAAMGSAFNACALSHNLLAEHQRHKTVLSRGLMDPSIVEKPYIIAAQVVQLDLSRLRVALLVGGALNYFNTTASKIAKLF
jgi:hypothetical protein